MIAALAIALFVASVVVACLAVLSYKDKPRLSGRQIAWIAVPVVVGVGAVILYRSVQGPMPAVAANLPAVEQATASVAEASEVESTKAPLPGVAVGNVAPSGAPAEEAPASGAAPIPASAAAAAPDGKALFATNCAACHQTTGLGVPGAFPPLAGSEVPNGPATRHIHFVLDGHSGPLTVQGKPFNGVMPSFKGRLAAADIAAILTYERTSWGNHGGPVTTAQVKAQGG